MRLRRSTRFASLALCVFSALSASPASGLDSGFAHELRVGMPRGPAPLFRLDAGRTGRTPSPLPSRPAVLWRARIPGSIDFPALVDEDLSCVVAGRSGVVQIAADGRLEWSLNATPVGAPALSASGLRILTTASGELLYVSRKGKVARRVQLAPGPVRSAAPLLPTLDGGMLVALAGDVLRLDANGSVRATTRVNDEVRALLQSERAFVFVTELGDVHSWSPPSGPRKLGNFGGRTSAGAALLQPERLTAVVDQTRLVDFDLSTATRRVRADASSSLLLQGVPAITGSRETRLLSSDGLLIGHDLAGSETLRVALDAQRRAPGRKTPAHFAGAPGLVVDRAGATAFALPDSLLGVVSPSGELNSVADAGCVDPVSLVPAGRRRLLLACRSGQLWMLGDAPKPLSGAAR